MEARSSQDLACCWRATEIARSKYGCAFKGSPAGDLRKCDVASDAIDLGFTPRFFPCFDRGHRLADTTPRIIEFAKFRVSSRQPRYRYKDRLLRRPLPLATLIRHSTSRSVRCSRSRPISLLLRRRSVTVRNPESDAASRRFVLAMIFAPAQSGLGVIWIEIGQCIKPDSPRHIDRVPAAPP